MSDINHYILYISCWNYKAEFWLNNKLHWHICRGCIIIVNQSSVKLSLSSLIIVSLSNLKPLTQRYTFQDWWYATANAKFSQKQNVLTESVCIDSECIMSLIDWQFFYSLTLNNTHNIQQTASSISVCDLRTATHQISEYITLNVYLSDTDDRTAYIKKKFHLINDLKTKILIEIDILTAEKITVKLKSTDSVMTIESC